MDLRASPEGSIADPERSVGYENAQHRPEALTVGERWYAVHTLPFAEARAEGQLRNQRFRTFQPKRLKTVRHARKLSTVEAPYFPRYLFIVLDLGRHQWRKVNGTFGVSRLVMRGDQPHPVPPGVVEALIATADARSILQLDDKLQIGGPVRLMAGPFAEQLAILDHLNDTGRVRVLLDILGRQVAISTAANNILPLT
jgi:transcription elongation factor/antiterminator RfaH